MILVIDNYDSFTFNLVQYLGELGGTIEVSRNDAMDVSEVKRLNPAGLVVSPGPGRPENAGITVDLVKELAGHLPILGVCLGHQAIALAFGGEIINAPKLVHGKTSLISYDSGEIFDTLSNPFAATRYHSLMVERESLPAELEILAETEDGIIMALRHRDYPVYGVQFHPESILTIEGKKILKNFIRVCGREST